VTKTIGCKDKLTIARVPYALDPANSGVSVTVRMPDGRELAEPNVVVEDLFIVALGDSFASGESNPDRPVQFSAAREMLYDPIMMREEVASRSVAKGAMPRFGLASSESHYDPMVLPRRLLDDEAKERFYPLSSAEFREAWAKASARWLSRLSPFSIRLSVPRRDRACAGESPSRDHAGDLYLLGRRGGRGLVSRHGSARGRERDSGRQGSRPA
jgi:hypothetical protein